jgi:hypothetical protein
MLWQNRNNQNQNGSGGLFLVDKNRLVIDERPNQLGSSSQIFAESEQGHKTISELEWL